MSFLKALALGFLIQSAPLAASPQASSSDPFQSNLLAIGYHIATLADFVGKPDYDKRLDDPTGFPAFSADFSGDGRRGEARILLNPSRDLAYVVLGLSSPKKVDTYVIKIYSLSNIDFIGIREAEPASSERMTAGITIFGLDDLSSETFDYTPDDFIMRPHSNNAPLESARGID